MSRPKKAVSVNTRRVEPLSNMYVFVHVCTYKTVKIYLRIFAKARAHISLKGFFFVVNSTERLRIFCVAFSTFFGSGFSAKCLHVNPFLHDFVPSSSWAPSGSWENCPVLYRTVGTLSHAKKLLPIFYKRSYVEITKDPAIAKIVSHVDRQR